MCVFVGCLLFLFVWPLECPRMFANAVCAIAACSKVKHTKLSNYITRAPLSSERILVIREEKNSVLVIFEETCMLTPV